MNEAQWENFYQKKMEEKEKDIADLKDQLSKCVEIKSKGQAKRISIQNPELFDEVCKAMGYIKVEKLPSEDEIEDVLLKTTKLPREETIGIAKAIHERINSCK